MIFLHYLLRPATIIAVIIPLLFCLFAFYREFKEPRTSAIFLFIMLLCLPVTMMTASWGGGLETNHSFTYGLHILPIFFIITLIWRLSPFTMPPFSKATIVAYTYLNLLLADLVAGFFPMLVPNLVTSAFDKPVKPEMVAYFVSQNPNYHYLGVGAAGFKDILFIVFAISLTWAFFEHKWEARAFRREEALFEAGEDERVSGVARAQLTKNQAKKLRRKERNG